MSDRPSQDQRRALGDAWLQKAGIADVAALLAQRQARPAVAIPARSIEFQAARAVFEAPGGTASQATASDGPGILAYGVAGYPDDAAQPDGPGARGYGVPPEDAEDDAAADAADPAEAPGSSRQALQERLARKSKARTEPGLSAEAQAGLDAEMAAIRAELAAAPLHPTVQASAPSGLGLSKLKVGAAYRGEFEARTLNPSSAPKANFRTREMTPEERARKTYRLNERGQFIDADNEPAEIDAEMVIDPENLDVVKFAVKPEVTEPDGTRRALKDKETVFDLAEMGTDITVMHHSSALPTTEETLPDGSKVRRAAEVALAGSIKTDNQGRLVNISNDSGHYKPRLASVLAVLEQFAQRGVFHEHDLVDAKGQPVGENDPAAKIIKAFDARKQQVAALRSRVATLAEATQALAVANDAQTWKRGPAPSADAVADMAAQVKALEADVKPFAAALEALTTYLRKRGIGPSWKPEDPTGDWAPTVSIKQITPGMSGGDVKESKAVVYDAGAVLRSGGGIVVDGAMLAAAAKAVREDPTADPSETQKARTQRVLNLAKAMAAEQAGQRAAQVDAVTAELKRAVPDITREGDAQFVPGAATAGAGSWQDPSKQDQPQRDWRQEEDGAARESIAPGGDVLAGLAARAKAADAEAEARIGTVAARLAAGQTQSQYAELSEEALLAELDRITAVMDAAAQVPDEGLPGAPGDAGAAHRAAEEISDPRDTADAYPPNAAFDLRPEIPPLGAAPRAAAENSYPPDDEMDLRPQNPPAEEAEARGQAASGYVDTGMDLRPQIQPGAEPGDTASRTGGPA